LRIDIFDSDAAHDSGVFGENEGERVRWVCWR
jgi:hypothetical protein